MNTLPSLLDKLKILNYSDIHIVDDGSDDGTNEFLDNSEFS